MADKESEEEKLRKQISFLKNLISSAQTKKISSAVDRVNNYAHTSGQSERMPAKTYNEQSCITLTTRNDDTRNSVNKRDHRLNRADYSASSKHPSSTKSSQYTWRKSNTILDNAYTYPRSQNSSEAKDSDTPLFARRKQTSTITPSLSLRQDDGHVKSEPLESSFTHSTGVEYSALYSSSHENTSKAMSHNLSSSQYSSVQYGNEYRRRTSHRIAPYSSRASTSKSRDRGPAVQQIKHVGSTSNLQISIQQKLLNTEQAIQDLKKDMETLQKAASVEQQKQKKLQSLSPYKLQKVPCNPSTRSVQHADNNQSVSSEKLDLSNTISRSFNNTSNVEGKASSDINHMYTKKQTPSKLVVKTRYAIKRVRRSSINKNQSRNSVHSISNQPEAGTSSSSTATQQAANTVKHKHMNYPHRTRGEQNKVQSDYEIHRHLEPSCAQPTGYQMQWPGVSHSDPDQMFQHQRGPPHKGTKKKLLYRNFIQSLQGPPRGRRTRKYKGRRPNYIPSFAAPWKTKPSRHCGQQRKRCPQNGEWLRQNVPFDPRMKVDRRPVSPEKSRRDRQRLRAAIENLQKKIERAQKPVSNKPNRYARAAGTKIVTYRRRSNSHSKDVTYSIGRNGKKLTRLRSTEKLRPKGTQPHSWKATQRSREQNKIQVQGITYVESAPGVWEKSQTVQTRKLARRVINRSKAKLAARHLKKRKLCMFYNRFGNCRKGSACPDIHDPDKVAVCTKFLRSACFDKNCRFSHKTTKEKMPVCVFFLKGNCNRDDCPYSHMNVNKDAEVCADFLRGYCSQGEKCKKKHILVCEEFSKTGKCSLGRKCRLQHRVSRPNKAKEASNRSNKKQDSSNVKEASFESASVSSSVVDLSIVKQETILIEDEQETVSVKQEVDSDDAQQVVEPVRIQQEIKEVVRVKQEPVSDSEQDERQSNKSQPSLERKLPAYISLNLKKENDVSQNTSSSNSSAPDKGLKIRPHL